MRIKYDDFWAMIMSASRKVMPEIIEQANKEWSAKRGRICFECGNANACHQHHVIPQTLGGKSTVPLCETCHGKVHGRDMMNHRELTRSGLAEARRKGRVLGRPKGSTLDAAELVARHPDIARHLRAGHSIRHAAAITGKSTGTVQAVKRAMEKPS